MNGRVESVEVKKGLYDNVDGFIRDLWLCLVVCAYCVNDCLHSYFFLYYFVYYNATQLHNKLLK